MAEFMQFVSDLLTVSQSLQCQTLALGHEPDCQPLLQQMVVRKYESVVSTATDLLAEVSDSASIWYLRGDALAHLGRYGEAIDSFTQTLRYCPHAKLALAFQAVCWIHLTDYERALACCDRALDIDSAHAQAWIFRGVALHRLGRYREAYRCYDRATANDARPWWQRLPGQSNR